MIQKFIKLLSFGSVFTNAAFTAIPGQTCGVSDSGLRIVGGQEATDSTEFPWQAKFKPCWDFGVLSCSLCGATLISELWLVSAAHCTAQQGSTSVSVSDSQITIGGIVGGFNAEAGIQSRFLVAIEDHPQYVSVSQGHDITLLKVASAIIFSSEVHPACLPKENDCFAEGSETWISGFGAVEYEGNIADTQKFAMVPIYNLNECRQTYNNFDESTQVCAGYAAGGTDACQGDSGGPLAVSYNDVWYLYGVTSYGVECATAGFPGVYARVTNYSAFLNFCWLFFSIKFHLKIIFLEKPPRDPFFNNFLRNGGPFFFTKQFFERTVCRLYFEYDAG